jgi:hypothetical protein
LLFLSRFCDHSSGGIISLSSCSRNGSAKHIAPALFAANVPFERVNILPEQQRTRRIEKTDDALSALPNAIEGLIPLRLVSFPD